MILIIKLKKRKRARKNLLSIFDRISYYRQAECEPILSFFYKKATLSSFSSEIKDSAEQMHVIRMLKLDDFIDEALFKCTNNFLSDEQFNEARNEVFAHYNTMSIIMKSAQHKEISQKVGNELAKTYVQLVTERKFKKEINELTSNYIGILQGNEFEKQIKVNHLNEETRPELILLAAEMYNKAAYEAMNEKAVY